MDQSLLVAGGHRLVDLLSKEGSPPRAAIWVHYPDANTWKLWIVPNKDITDRFEFYQQISRVISSARESMHGLDAGEIEMIAADHEAMQALKSMFRVSGNSDIRISNNTLNGFFIPDGIILHLDYQ